MRTGTVTLPVSLVEKMLTASESFTQFSDELEDFLLARDPKFIAKMRAARADHLSGKTRPFEEIERKIAARVKARRTTRSQRA